MDLLIVQYLQQVFEHPFKIIHVCAASMFLTGKKLTCHQLKVKHGQYQPLTPTGLTVACCLNRSPLPSVPPGPAFITLTWTLSIPQWDQCNRLGSDDSPLALSLRVSKPHVCLNAAWPCPLLCGNLSRLLTARSAFARLPSLLSCLSPCAVATCISGKDSPCRNDST